MWQHAKRNNNLNIIARYLQSLKLCEIFRRSFLIFESEADLFIPDQRKT